jgi:homopolymeric O-antigen transport system ATP-binding protein
MSYIAIRVENLSKKYVISHQRERGHKTLCDVITERLTAPWRSLASRLKYAGTPNNGNGKTPSVPGSQLNSELRPPTLTPALAPREDFWALKDVCFEINQGEVVGVIGRNGAGKSTLLKILSRITEPTKGRIEIDGRVASLLEVGTGFHPELTGRENIYLNGAMLGMSHAEIRAKFDEIVAFAEVDSFLDTPIKRYSSGMYVRLAFAVAAHLEPEILFIDEVLAVGDAEFQRKCLGKMEEVSQSKGRTILFVSHNLAHLKQICHSAVLLDSGKMLAKTSVDNAIASYAGLIYESGSFYWRNNETTGDFIITEIAMKNSSGIIQHVVNGLDNFYLEIAINARRRIANSLLSIRFTNQENIPIYTTTNGDATLSYPLIAQGNHLFRVPVPVHLFVPGRYSMTVAWSVPNYELLYRVEDTLQFEIENDQYPGNILRDARAGVLNKSIAWETLS